MLLRNLFLGSVFMTFDIGGGSANHVPDDGLREVFAVPVSTSGDPFSPSHPKSNDKSKLTEKKGTNMPDSVLQERNKEKDIASVKDNQQSRRLLGSARTTLTNVNVDSLTTAEMIFLEDAWQVALQESIQGQDMSVRGVFMDESTIGMQEAPGALHVSGWSRHLRSTRRGLESYFNFDFGQAWPSTTHWFDIWSMFEVTCTFCETGSDNFDDDDYYGGRKMSERQLVLKPSFEDLLCEILRNGPFECFGGVKECMVTFA